MINVGPHMRGTTAARWRGQGRRSRKAPVDSRWGKAWAGRFPAGPPVPASAPQSCQNGRKTTVTSGHQRIARTTSELDERRLTPCLKRPS